MSNGSKVSYPTMDAGIQAGDQLLQNAAAGESQYYSPTETLSQFGNTYSGGDPNWANNVGSYLGIPTSTPMSDVFAQTGNGSSLPSISDLAGSSLSALTGATPLGSITGAAVQTKQWWSLWDPARWAVAIIGVILIIVGLTLFHSTQTIIQRGSSIAAKGAALLA